MRRITHTLAAAALVLGLGATVLAQNPNNMNDLRLYKGIDFLYVYSDPSIGSPVGTFPPDFANSDYFWKVWPKEVTRHCSGILEVSGINFYSFDTDYTTVDGSGNNTVLYDMMVSTGIASVNNAGQIEPDLADPLAVVLQFGAGTPDNNAFLPDPGCPTPGFVNGYELDVQIGTGAGDGIFIVADGSTDYVLTHIIPSNMCGPFGPCAGLGTCGDGDMALQDTHSSCLGGGIGETQADWLGTGWSAYGGFAIAGSTAGGVDTVCETPVSQLEFFERILAMRVDSGTGNGPEEGLAALQFSLGAAGGGFNSIGARYYSRQGVGNLAGVVGSVFPPLPVCLPLGGGGSGLGIDPNQPLFNLFLSFWLGTVTLEDFDDTGASLGVAGDPFDEGHVTTIQIGPLPGGLAGLALHFQALEKLSTGGLRSSQLNRIIFNP